MMTLPPAGGLLHKTLIPRVSLRDAGLFVFNRHWRLPGSHLRRYIGVNLIFLHI